MEPVSLDRARILVLNYNGRALLEECLPSVVEAARRSPIPCGVAVVDNDSADDSVAWLAANHPDVAVVRRPNRGLASFNDALAGMDEPVALLLNNDVKLAPDSIAPLLRPLAERDDARFGGGHVDSVLVGGLVEQSFVSVPASDSGPAPATLPEV